MANITSSIYAFIIGTIMIIGGASGNLVLRGTNRSDLLMLLGIVVIAFGIYNAYKSKNE